MFNVKIKNGFIEERMQTNVNIKNSINNIFTRAEKYEDLYQKDICNWNTEEIMTFYKMLTSSSLEYLMVINNILQGYTNYCMVNSMVIDSQNHYSEITNEILFECVNKQLTDKRIITREELYSLIDSLANECDKFIILAIFEGLYGKAGRDLYFIKKDDIKNNSIKTKSGKELQVSDKLVQIAIKSANTYEYYSSSSSDGKSINFKDDDPKVIKAMVNSIYDDSQLTDIMTYRRIYTKVMNAKKQLDLKNFSINTIKESGRIDMIRTYMRDENIDAEEAISRHSDDIYYKYGELTSIKRYVLKYKDELKG